MLLSFFYVFPNRLADESLKVELSLDGGLSTLTCVFLELYCPDPTCDCRKVTFRIVNENFKTLATIAYGWESINFYKRWGILKSDAQELRDAFLDPLETQSEYAEHLLQFVRQVVLKDEAYMKTLRKHYRQFKKFVGKKESSTQSNAQIIPFRQPTDKKANRNAPCPCGSGKKYKKCCLPSVTSSK